jgi:four helix bundle protein
MATTCFTQLRVWQEAHRVTLSVYAITRQFPEEERFGLAAQMRRCAVSVPANVAEGFARRHAADKARFYNIAEASAEELKYFCMLSRDLKYPADPALLEATGAVCRMLRKLVDRTLGG